MANPKLVYVNARGRAELVRFIFAYKGVEYTDERVDMANLKATLAGTPVGILPTLEIEGKTLSGTVTVSRFLSEKYDLSGSNNLENAAVSSIVEGVDEIWIRMIAYFFETDEAAKERIFKQLSEEVIPGKFGLLERMAAASTAPEKWLWGGKLTYADFAVCTLIDALKTKLPDVCKPFPSLEKLCSSVCSLPAIQKWLEERPSTPF